MNGWVPANSNVGQASTDGVQGDMTAADALPTQLQLLLWHEIGTFWVGAWVGAKEESIRTHYLTSRPCR
jgi:hypothetical protein